MDNFKIYTDKDIRTVYSSSPEIVTIPIGDESVPKPGDIYYTDGVNVRSSKLIGKWDSEVFTLGDNGLCNACDMVLDSSGNIYVTGFITGNVTLGSFPLTLSGGTRSAFVGKMNSSGVWQWAKAIGNSSRTEGLYIVLDSLDNVYIAGNFTGAELAISGLDTLNSTNNSFIGNVFIVKMNNNGDYVWSYNNGKSSLSNPTLTMYQDNRPVGFGIDSDDFLYIGYNVGYEDLGDCKIEHNSTVLKINSDNTAVTTVSTNSSGLQTLYCVPNSLSVVLQLGDNNAFYVSYNYSRTQIVGDFTVFNRLGNSTSPFIYMNSNLYAIHGTKRNISVQDLDTLISSGNGISHGLLKKSLTEEFIWDTNFNATKFIPRALVADSNGDMYIVGNFLAPLHINNKIISNKVEGEYDGIVIKIDEDDGQVLGINILYGTNVMMRNAVMHSDDVLYITGQHTTLNLENKDSTITETQTTEESFIIKLDTAFNNGMEPVFISANPSAGSVQVQII